MDHYCTIKCKKRVEDSLIISFSILIAIQIACRYGSSMVNLEGVNRTTCVNLNPKDIFNMIKVLSQLYHNISHSNN